MMQVSNSEHMHTKGEDCKQSAFKRHCSPLNEFSQKLEESSI